MKTQKMIVLTVEFTRTPHFSFQNTPNLTIRRTPETERRGVFVSGMRPVKESPLPGKEDAGAQRICHCTPQPISSACLGSHRRHTLGNRAAALDAPAPQSAF